MACGPLPRACEGTLHLHMPAHSDLDLQQVKHAAALARLNLTEEELVAIYGDLASILTHIDQLAKDAIRLKADIAVTADADRLGALKDALAG